MYKVKISESSLPEKFTYTDTLDAFYLPEDPKINAAAFVLFPEYKYNMTDERLHLPRPIFDTVARKYFINRALQ